MERARENSHCFKLGGKKKGPKYYTTKYLRKHSELFDGMEMISYEEVGRLMSEENCEKVAWWKHLIPLNKYF
jgi:hypothetical protein